jgi:predicted regulator of amino acid metabolism with ACT domain
VIEKPNKNARVMSSKESKKYIEDIAKKMGIDLSKADDKTTEEILSKASSSLSDDIIKMRNKQTNRKYMNE